MGTSTANCKFHIALMSLLPPIGVEPGSSATTLTDLAASLPPLLKGTVGIRT